jgi:hypothetical protein
MKSSALRFLFSVFVLAGIALFASTGTYAGGDAVTIELKKGSVTLNPPFEVEETLLYKDGGTIGIVIKDSQGISLPLCLDGRIKMPAEDRHVYVGATYPDESSALRVTSGSANQKTLLELLQSAKITNPSPRIREDLVKAVIAKLKGQTSRLLIDM